MARAPGRKRRVLSFAPLALSFAACAWARPPALPLVAAVLAAGTPVAPDEPPPVAEPRFRFNFKGQTYDQILDYFSRVTGYPVVREAPVPAGTVDYLYPGEYALPEALETLNVLLQTQGVMLRVDGKRLFLQKLDDM